MKKNVDTHTGQNNGSEFNPSLIERLKKPGGALEIIVDILHQKIAKQELIALFNTLPKDYAEDLTVMIECFEEEYKKNPNIIEQIQEHLKTQSNSKGNFDLSLFNLSQAQN